MNDTPHHIRLVAGFEIRPPAPGARFVLERAASERLGDLIADDLAACVPGVTTGHLVTGAALLEPGQLTNPLHAPWKAMRTVAELEGDFQAGVTSIGAHRGHLSHPELGPAREPPQGLFLCLPILLGVAGAQAQELESALERVLFESGGLQPPTMGTLVELTGLDPVHGQLMTVADLVALLKMQLAGAGLDPFWPPVEHVLISPDAPARVELPAGLEAEYDVEARGWIFDFVSVRQCRQAGAASVPDYPLWLRAFRQTTALLETYLIPWRVRVDETVADVDAEVDGENRWVHERGGVHSEPTRAWVHRHPSVGLVAYSAVLDGVLHHYYPLHSEVLGELEQHLEAHGCTSFERNSDLALLES